MTRFAFAVLALALAGTACAAGWRDLRIDASSQAAFEESVAAFQEQLSPSRRAAFERSLQDVWVHGEQSATAEGREYTDADYFEQLDRLRYDEVVTLTDPTGKTAKRYRADYHARASRGRVLGTQPASPVRSPPPVSAGEYRGVGRAIDGGIRNIP